jgi:hypothetical protein
MQRRKTIGNSFGFIEPSESRLGRDTDALNYPQWTLFIRVRRSVILATSPRGGLFGRSKKFGGMRGWLPPAPRLPR